MSDRRVLRGFSRSRAKVARARGAFTTGAVLVILSVASNLLALVPPLGLVQLFDRIIPEGAVETLVLVLLAVTAALMLEVLLIGVRRVLIAWHTSRREHELNRQLFARILAAHPATRRSAGPGTYAERFATIERLRDQSCDEGGLPVDLTFSVLFIGAIYVFGGWLAAIPAVLMAVSAGIWLLREPSDQRSLLEVEAIRGRQMNFVLETFDRITAIKAAGFEAPMMRRFERLYATGAGVQERAARWSVPWRVMQSMIVAAGVVGVTVAGSWVLMAGELTLGELAACALLAGRALHPVQRGFGALAADRALRMVRQDADAGLSLPPARAADCPSMPRLQGAITLEDVVIRAGRQLPPLLDKVSLQVGAGAMIGITGEAASGKTALLMLVAGQQRPDAGRVLLDGRFDPQAHCEEGLLRQVVYLPERAPIYAGTLLENITMFSTSVDGAGHGGRQRERAYALAARVGLEPIAARLPLGFNTPIGPGSVHSLPRGVAQRVGLARALYAAPRILLFDAANTALDAAGDAMMRRLLEEERGSYTMLIVSQRPSLLRMTDCVYTLADGELRPPAPSRYVSMVRQKSIA